MSETGSSRWTARGEPVSRGSTTSRLLVVGSTDAAPEAPRAGGSSLDNEATVISGRTPFAELVEPRHPHPLEVGRSLEGERLGQFVLEKFVGGGGMGAVFRALDTTLNREVAVKILSRDQSGDEETLRRFKNEAQSAARLDHDNIARVYYVGEDRGVHYIVFEFIEGVNIRDLVESRGPLPLAEAVSYTHQVAEALAHASQRDVIHRDIKPSNVLITPDGKAKLVDMGLARLHQVEHPDNDLTASGVTLGTFDYISPEQARDPRSADVRSDLYSLGCSFYYMLTGRPPFPDGTVLQKLLQHQGDEPPDPCKVRPDLPAEVPHILTKLLAKSPTRRYQQPGELIAALLVLGQQIGLPQPVQTSAAIWTPPRPEPPPAWMQHVPWIVPIAALVLIVVGLDFVWSPTNDTTTTANTGADRSNTGGKKPKVNTADRKVARGNGKTGGEGATTPAAVVPAVPDLEPAAPRTGGATSENPESTAGASTDNPKSSAGEGPGSQVAPNKTGQGLSASKEPGQPAPGADPNSAEREGVLVVSDTEEGNHVFPNLLAACAAAKNGDVIELRYNGRREERPISLANTRLTIRAGDRFRPVLSFRPMELDPIKYPRSMLTVAGGQLTLINLPLELDVPRDVAADRWSLIEARKANFVRLEKCSLTIRNAAPLGQTAYHADVSFFLLTSALGNGALMPDLAAPETTVREEPATSLELQNCIARGEATFLHVDELQPFHLSWNNGLLVTSERLLRTTGGAMPPRGLSQVAVELRHLTAITKSGLVELAASDEAPYQLNSEILCADSILSCVATSPLVEQVGPSRTEDFQARLSWDGDRNFYDGVELFWRIANTMVADDMQQFLFSDWRAHWSEGQENLPSRSTVAWKSLPPADRPLYAQTPIDYAITTGTANNPTRGAASDGLDVGVLAELLPALPVDEPAEAATP